MTPRKPGEDILNGFTGGREESNFVISAVRPDFDFHGDPRNGT
jgi:hypothetical protein